MIILSALMVGTPVYPVDQLGILLLIRNKKAKKTLPSQVSCRWKFSYEGKGAVARGV